MLKFNTIYTDRFIRKIVESDKGNFVARNIYGSKEKDYTFASRETGVDIYTETLSIPDKAFDVFNPYNDNRSNCYSFKRHRDAVEYAFPPDNFKEIVDFLEKEEDEDSEL